MYRQHEVGVVVPAYNEERFIADVIDSVPEFCDRVYAVDDGSTDGTWEAIERCARVESRMPVADGGNERRPDRRVVPIRHETNRGVGGAIKTGYRRAYEDGMDVVAVMAGDDQMDPSDMDRLLDPIVDGRADYTKGTRFRDQARRSGMSAWRLFGTVVLTYLTRAASGYWHLSDPQNGYTAISRQALAEVDVDELYEAYGFCNDLLIRLSAHDLTVVDVPVDIDYGTEESHIRYRTFIPKLLSLLLVRFLWRLRVEYWDGVRSGDARGDDSELPARHDR